MLYHLQDNYNLDADENQPLLVHRPKPKEQRMRDLQGLKGNILLIPQLCNLTGLGTMRQVSAPAVEPIPLLISIVLSVKTG